MPCSQHVPVLQSPTANYTPTPTPNRNLLRKSHSCQPEPNQKYLIAWCQLNMPLGCLSRDKPHVGPKRPQFRIRAARKVSPQAPGPKEDFVIRKTPKKMPKRKTTKMVRDENHRSHWHRSSQNLMSSP